MADFSGAVYVALDDEMVGDGSNIGAPQGTMFLDSFAEASLRADCYYIIEGYDSLAWSPPVGDTDTTVVTETRPFSGLDEWTILPPFLMPIWPAQTGIEVSGLYRVADEGAGSDVFRNRIEIYPVGAHSFNLTHTVASTPDWQPFTRTMTFQRRFTDVVWVRFTWFGSGIDTANVGAAATAGNAVGLVKSMLNATSTGSIYSEGTGSEPNSTTLGIRATEITELGGSKFSVDHIHFYDPSGQDYMVTNPPVTPGDGNLAAQQRQLTYLQLAGVTIRPIYETEVNP